MLAGLTRASALIALVLLTACADDDRGPVAAGAMDTGPPEDAAGEPDAGELDGGEPDGGEPADAVAPGPCLSFLFGAPVGHVESPALAEISGVAASRTSPGVFWVHNDSGEPRARFFAIGEDGRHLGEYTLVGARFWDWEDIAVGPGPTAGVDYLYLGDVGDNAARTGGLGRASVTVYRVAEPEATVDQEPAMVDLTDWDEITVTYPDRPHDCETLMVDPETGDLYLITKEDAGVSRVFVARAPVGTTVTVTEVGTIAFGTDTAPGSVQSTAGDIAPDGRSVLVRTYTSALLWPRDRDQDLAEALSAPAISAPTVVERQGEAIAFAADGSGYYTISEGVSPAVNFFAAGCTP
jgi:hypothetical protein